MKKLLKTAFVDTLPVLTGYLVLGFGFGIIMKANGFSTLLSIVAGTFCYMLLVQMVF